MDADTPLRGLAAPPVFIVGFPRSGTTWLLDILGAHPKVATVFESFLFSSRVGLGAVPAQLTWHPEYAKYQLERTGKASGIAQLISREQMIEDLRALSSRWLAGAVDADGGERFLAAKENEAADLDTIAALHPDARFIHILRDGRDVAVSYRAAARSWAPEMVLGKRSTFTLARHWKQGVREIRGNLRMIENASIEVRYEDLAADQIGEQQRIFRFCEIPHDDVLCHEIVAETSIEKQRATVGSGFRNKGRVGTWRADFNRLDALLFEAGGGDLLVELGYEARRGWSRRGR